MKRARPPATSARAVITAPQIDPRQVAHLADRLVAGDAVRTASIEECCALLAELKRRGYALRNRSDADKQQAPFDFEVVRLENTGKI